jgi:hypothetical protein
MRIIIYCFIYTLAYNKIARMKRGEVRMLSVKETATRLGANEGSVRAWCIAGRFPNASRLDTPRGPVWQIPETDLTGFENRGPGRPPKPAQKNKKK